MKKNSFLKELNEFIIGVIEKPINEIEKNILDKLNKFDNNQKLRIFSIIKHYKKDRFNKNDYDLIDYIFDNIHKYNIKLNATQMNEILRLFNKLYYNIIQDCKPYFNELDFADKLNFVSKYFDIQRTNDLLRNLDAQQINLLNKKRIEAFKNKYKYEFDYFIKEYLQEINDKRTKEQIINFTNEKIIGIENYLSANGILDLKTGTLKNDKVVNIQSNEFDVNVYFRYYSEQKQIQSLKKIIYKLEKFEYENHSSPQEFIKSLLEPQQKQPSSKQPTQNKINSFEFKGEPEQLIKIHQSLTENNFIDEIDYSDFENIFYNKHTAYFKPIIWIDRAKNKQFAKNTIFEFINEIQPNLLDNSTNLYNVIINYFRDGNNKKYTRLTLKSSFSKWSNKKPSSKNKREKQIQNIVKTVIK